MTKNIKELTTTIFDWLAIKDPLEKSDLIFVFGGPTLSQVKKAKQIFDQGFAPYILVTGNTGTFNNPDWNKPIANIFCDFLVENKVNPENILVQNTSMNTLEDVTCSIPIIKAKFQNFQKVILVSNPMHQRRCFATFKKQFPFDIEIINQAGDEPDLAKAGEEEVISIGTRCLQEYERLIKYSQEGDIETSIIPENVTNSYIQLKNILGV
jgi:hypothetical protein